MGRELRRVALDFDWPLNKRWPGFVSPDYKKCDECRGYGQHDAANVVAGIAGLIEMLGTYKERGHPWLTEFMRSFVSGMNRQTIPPKRITEFTDGLMKGTEGHRDPFFGNTYRNYQIFFRLLELAGLKKDWAECPSCDGTGCHPDDKKIYDDIENNVWQPTPPPKGPGYQIWETVSEGSPVSKVYPTEEAFMEYLTKELGHKEEAARKFIEIGSVPSFILTADRRILSNISTLEATGKKKTKD